MDGHSELWDKKGRKNCRFLNVLQPSGHTEELRISAFDEQVFGPAGRIKVPDGAAKSM